MRKWTQVLLSAGVISVPAIAQAEEAQPNAVLTSLSTTTLSGYIDTSAVWKFGTGNANMPGRVYDGPDVQDGFNLNVVSLTLNKPLDESEWAAGYNVQMLFGPGATKRGTGSLIGGGGDFAFNEAVVLLRVPVGNGLDLKVGQFGTYNGFEAYDTYKNPNWSRSYGFFIESSAHTGISGTYAISESLSVSAGVGNIAGFNNQVDAKSSIESKKAVLGMVNFTAPENLGFLAGSTWAVGYTYGDAVRAGGVGNVSGIPNPGGRWSQGNFYAGGTLGTPITGLKIGLAYDYTSGSAFAGSYANALAAYLTFDATEKLKLSGRADYGWGSDTAYGYSSVDGNNELISFTATADYSLWKNVISRAEFRWDRCLTDDTPFGGTVAGSPEDENALSLVFNVIYMF